MAKIGIFFGTDTGNTEIAAELIRSTIGEDKADIFDVRKVEDVNILDNYELLIIGASTWYLGELQGDMDSFLKKLEGKDLNNKKIALFGLGDQEQYSEFFLDGLGIMYNFFKDKGSEFFGETSTEGYNFSSVLAMGDNIDKFVGLGLDFDNQEELNQSRIEDWVNELKTQTNLF